MARADTVIVCSLPLAKNALHLPTSSRLEDGLTQYKTTLTCDDKGVHVTGSEGAEDMTTE